MGGYININGKLLPSNTTGIEIDSRAYRYGYGVFETMLVSERNIRLQSLHWQRLRASLDLLDIYISPHFFQEVAREVMRSVVKNKLERLCRVRLQVNAGHGGMYDGDSFGADYSIEVFPLDRNMRDLNEAGLVVGVADVVKATGIYANLKSCNSLPYAMAARQAKRSQWNDALLRNEHGNLIESTIANLFWIKDGACFTPPLTEGCIAGVMRQHLINAMPELGYPIHQQHCDAMAMESADGVFLTNSIKGIRWIRSIKDCEYGSASVVPIHEFLVQSLERLD